MSTSPLGAALRLCRDRRQLSLREMGQLAEIDHAYIHRLETGEKESPSKEVLEKLIKVLKPSRRDADLIGYLVEHAAGDPELVQYVLEDASVTLEEFEMAYGMRHRGTVRPDPRARIERARRVIEMDDG